MTEIKKDTVKLVKFMLESLKAGLFIGFFLGVILFPSAVVLYVLSFMLGLE